MSKTKDIYYVSGCTGIVAMDIGKSLLSQFPETSFHEEKFPFITNISDAQKALDYIISKSAGKTPIIFSSLVNPEIRTIFDHPEVELFDICEAFLGRIENCLETKALLQPGFSRQIDDFGIFKRAQAIDYCLEHDDGIKPKDYDKADVIVLGVSRTGKTPVSVYLSTLMELKSANFPLTEEHLNSYQLPKGICRNIKKTVGLTTNPEILSTIRKERYPGSNYSKLSTCRQELQQAAQIFRKYNIPTINTSRKSIEELAAQISQEIGLYKKTSLLKNVPSRTPEKKLFSKKNYSIRPEIPLTPCTGYSIQMDEEESQNFGINDFVFPSPISYNKFSCYYISSESSSQPAFSVRWPMRRREASSGFSGQE